MFQKGVVGDCGPVNPGALARGRKVIQTSVGVGVGTEQWQPEKALAPSGGTQAGCTEEVAFDLDTKVEEGAPGRGNHTNRSREARNCEACPGPLVSNSLCGHASSRELSVETTTEEGQRKALAFKDLL